MRATRPAWRPRFAASSSTAAPRALALLAIGGAEEHEGRDGVAWERFEEPGDGRPPQEVPMPPDLSPS